MTYGDKLWIIQTPFTAVSFREMSKLKFEAKREMHQRRDERHSYTKKIRRDERRWNRIKLNNFKAQAKIMGIMKDERV